MLASSRIMLLNLSLVIVVSGCSESRVRQLFSQDREFLSLSELRESRVNDGAGEDSAERLVSQSDSGSGEEKRSRFPKLSRVLPWRRDGDIPSDPFLESDAEDQNLPVIAAGPEKLLEDSEESTADSERSRERRQPKIEAIARESKRTSEFRGSADSLSFDRFLAELGSADESPTTADENAVDRGGMGTDSDGSTNGFDLFLADSTRDSDREESAESADSDVILSFDLLEEATRPDRFAPDDDPELVLVLNERTEMAESLLPDSFDSSDPVARTGAVDIFDSAAEEPATLWQAADVPFDWDDSESDHSDTVIRSEQDAAWIVSHQADSVLHDGGDHNQFTGRHGVADVSAQDGNTLLLPPTAPLVPIQSVSQAVDITEFAAADFDDDLFLDDFASQATAVAASTADSPSRIAPWLRKRSPSAWLLLLAGIVVTYLLIAPERRKPALPE